MFCKKCGAELPDGSAFCNKCGADLTKITAPAEAAAQPKKKTGRWVFVVLGIFLVPVLIGLTIFLVHTVRSKMFVDIRIYTRESFLDYQIDDEEPFRLSDWRVAESKTVRLKKGTHTLSVVNPANLSVKAATIEFTYSGNNKEDLSFAVKRSDDKLEIERVDSNEFNIDDLYL